MKHGITLSRACAAILIALLAMFSVSAVAFAAEGETTIIGLVPGEIGGFDGMPSVGGDTGSGTNPGNSGSNANTGGNAGSNTSGNSNSGSSTSGGSGYSYAAPAGSNSVHYSAGSSSGGSAITIAEEAAAQNQSSSRASILSAGLPLAYTLQDYGETGLLSHLASQGISYNTALQALASGGSHSAEATACVALFGLAIPGVSLTEFILMAALALFVIIALILCVKSHRLKRDLAGSHIANAATGGTAAKHQQGRGAAETWSDLTAQQSAAQFPEAQAAVAHSTHKYPPMSQLGASVQRSASSQHASSTQHAPQQHGSRPAAQPAASARPATVAKPAAASHQTQAMPLSELRSTLNQVPAL